MFSFVLDVRYCSPSANWLFVKLHIPPTVKGQELMQYQHDEPFARAILCSVPHV